MTEGIPNLEDRQFPTSMGHWTGDGYWDNQLYDGHLGKIAVDIPTPYQEKTILLQYPYFNAPAARLLTLLLKFSTKPITTQSSALFIQLIDGINTLDYFTIIVVHENLWRKYTMGFQTPTGWNKQNGGLKIRQITYEGNPLTIFWDDFSLQYETLAKVQYLPLVGVG